MNKISCLGSKGFSLVEAITALGVGLFFLTSVISLSVFTAKNWKVQSAKTQARFNVQEAMERLKEDTRLADGGKILFYPDDAVEYTAVSIPGATPDADGFYTLGDAGISWDQTIIYHVYDNELRRTVFDSFDTVVANRQADLDEAAEYGTIAGATTTTLFTADSTTLTITPTNQMFDGYSDSVEKSTNTNFGLVRLTAGDHTIQFKVEDKNDASSGYRIGIDKISLAPSGSNLEAEDLTVSASSGDTQTTEDMSSFDEAGLWGGNYQKEYAASAVDDYITFEVYYDQWLESNFSSMTHSNAEVTGTNPVLSLATRETQGLTPGWQATSQTAIAQEDNNSSGGTPSPAINGMTIRNVISSDSITRAGTMIRVKFVASSTGPLVITNAYFGIADGINFKISSSVQLFFSNGTVAEGGDDGVGAVGTGAPSEATITIPAGHHAWSNWIIPQELSVLGNSVVPHAIVYPRAVTDPNYLVSFAIDADASNADEAYWPAGGATAHSYLESGSTALSTWDVSDPGYTTNTSIHATQEIAIWASSGTATSQVYDTKIADPAFSAISWSDNGSGSYLLKARASDDESMAGATDWSAIAGSAASPAALSIDPGRYVQFQATLTAASPYTSYPELDAVNIKWPGQTSLVQLDGIYTKRPNYGIFSVLVDGATVTEALTINLNVEKRVQDRNYHYSLSAKVDCRNTNN